MCCGCKDLKLQGKISGVFGLLALILGIVTGVSTGTVANLIRNILATALEMAEVAKMIDATGYDYDKDTVDQIQQLVDLFQLLATLAIVWGCMTGPTMMIAGFFAHKENQGAVKGLTCLSIFFGLTGMIVYAACAGAAFGAGVVFQLPSIKDLCGEQLASMMNWVAINKKFVNAEKAALMDQYMELWTQMCEYIALVPDAANSALYAGAISVIIFFFTTIAGCAICSAAKNAAKPSA